MIVGGGFAGLESAVALRALAGDRARITVVSPDPRFRYRPAATIEVLGGGSPIIFDLPALLHGLDAGYAESRLDAAAPQLRVLRLGSGRQLSYDALILAIGALSHPAIPGAVTFRDQRDVPKVRRLLQDASSGGVSRLVVAVPSCRSWPLPAYELALLSAACLRGTRREVQVLVVSPEQAPLEAFGTETSRLVSELLVERDVRFVGGVTPRVARGGALELEFDAPVRADAVIAIPELRGRRIPGIPASWLGFIPTDSLGRVEGLGDVYAAGDATTFPIKQGGLATQQADRIAHVIASGLGAPVREVRPARVLQIRLLGGEAPLLVRSELDEFGQPTAPLVDRREHPAGAELTKVYARYLTPYLAQHQPLRSVTAP